MCRLQIKFFSRTNRIQFSLVSNPLSSRIIYFFSQKRLSREELVHLIDKKILNKHDEPKIIYDS